jgi:TolB protein
MLFKLLLLGCVVLKFAYADKQELQLSIVHNDAQGISQQEEKVPLLVVLHGDSSLLDPLSDNIRQDLEQTNQVQVKIIHSEQPKCIEDITQQFNEGYPFVLYLSMDEGESEVHGRLYNTLDVVMLQGKKWKKRDVLSMWAHHIAHTLWKEIMGTESSFLSSIVYVTKAYNRSKNVRSSLVLTDWDGSDPRILITRPTHILAPCWLPYTYRDDGTIIFSEFTPVNVCLMKIKSSGLAKAEVVLNHQGTTVGVSPCSCDNIVYCRSGVIWRYVYDSLLRTSEHMPIVREKEPCACPIALRNGDVIYCCKGKIKRWYRENGKREIIIKDGFCTSPALHEDRNILIFSRRVQGNFQLICKDLSTGIEKQITQGPGNKIDPSVSPCGFFVVYTVEQEKKSTIHILNVLTEISRAISATSDYCMCPAWSL